MPRHSRKLLSLIAACTVAAVASTTPASGQIDPGAIGELETRRDEISTEIGVVNAALAGIQREIAGLEDSLRIQGVQVELVADEIERTVDSRREPASTRIEIAIVGFTQGDPRQNALIDEVRTLEGDDEAARRRVLYESVIEDANERLAIIDFRLTELADELSQSRSAVGAATASLSTAVDEEQELGARRTELALELEDVKGRIQRLRDLENKSVLTGLSTFDDPNRAAFAVKIDNVPAARPQAGINQADIVFVEEVEGGLTRLAAVFHSTGADVVGPVRSMRTGDFDLLAQFNSPLFGNSGGNRGTTAALADSTLVDIGVRAEPSLYYRNSSRRAPHNLFTNAFNVWTVGADLEETGTPSPMFVFRSPDEPVHSTAGSASGVTISYRSTTVEYDWNGVSWDRTQDGVPTVDTRGVRTSPTTVIVQYTNYVPSAADGASPEAITIGTGRALIFTDGNIVDTVWRREDPSRQTQYVDGQGNLVKILPGRTWVELPRPDDATAR